VKILKIDWIDSASEHGWLSTQEVEDLEGLGKCQTVGYFVKETKNSISIAQNRSTDHIHCPFGEIITIPKVAIIKKRELK